MFLWEQFSQFGNFYFLMVAFSQLIPQLSIGYWWASWGPLSFVVMISMMREIVDDIHRAKRDYKVNNQKYLKIIKNNNNDKTIASSKIKVGDLIILHENQTVPCDMILLHCSNPNGSTFIKTDQLDGETDWKLRKSVPHIQKQYASHRPESLSNITGELVCKIALHVQYNTSD